MTQSFYFKLTEVQRAILFITGLNSRFSLFLSFYEMNLRTKNYYYYYYYYSSNNNNNNNNNNDNRIQSG